ENLAGRIFINPVYSPSLGATVCRLLRHMPQGGWGGRPRETQEVWSGAVSARVNAGTGSRVMRYGDGWSAGCHATPRGMTTHVFRKHIPRRGRVGCASGFK